MALKNFEELTSCRDLCAFRDHGHVLSLEVFEMKRFKNTMHKMSLSKGFIFTDVNLIKRFAGV